MSTAAPPFQVGDWVKALDRDNFGQVVDVRGDQVTVHFVSPSGYEATKTFPANQLEPTSPRASAPASSRRPEGPPQPSKLDIYELSRVVAGLELNGELDALSPTVRRMLDHLTALDVEARYPAWEAMMAAREDADAIREAVLMADPLGPPPEPEAGAEPRPRPANLADVRAASDGVEWLWEGYIPAARLGGIGAYEGVGKTRLALDLARRIWHGMPWPDGQPATLPPGTPTLWVCADGQQDEIAADAAAFGMPDEAILFNTPFDDPHGGTEVDSTEAIERLEDYIQECKPGIAFIDTLTYATARDVCRATETKEVLAPLRDIALRTRVTIIPMMHLSKEGQVLGRRSKGLTRSLIHLERPDPDQPARLRLWVDKTSRKPVPALGVTMGDAGNEYDHNPPTKPEPIAGGRPPEAREKAERFILEALARENDRTGNDLQRECETAGAGKRNTFWRAVDDLVERGEIVKDGGKGTGKQTVLHLIRPEADPTPPPDLFPAG